MAHTLPGDVAERLGMSRQGPYTSDWPMASYDARLRRVLAG
jgi:hypothetical protein